MSLDTGGRPVLSLYVDIRPQLQPERAYLAAAKSLLSDLADTLDEDARERLEPERQRAQGWLEENRPTGRSLALFSCSPVGFWQAHYLAVPVRQHAAFETTPYLTPLLDLLDEYERTAVVLVDKEKARLFTVFLGEIEEHKGFKDFVPGKHDQGGWSQMNYQRHHEEHVYEHLKDVVGAIQELQRDQAWDRLILSGPEEPVTALHGMLPESLSGLVVDTFPGAMYARDSDVLRWALDVNERLEREAEVRLLEELLGTAAAGHTAVQGAENVLDAAWQANVQKLLLSEGLDLSGTQCEACGHLDLSERDRCPACGGKVARVGDMVERVAHRVLEAGGSLEFLHGAPSDKLRETSGGVGAFTRHL